MNFIKLSSALSAWISTAAGGSATFQARVHVPSELCNTSAPLLVVADSGDPSAFHFVQTLQSSNTAIGTWRQQLLRVEKCWVNTMEFVFPLYLSAHPVSTTLTDQGLVPYASYLPEKD
ncbi:hypothetical protein [Pseudomonas sp. UBA6310]|uniref:hypothetical protein n=1 Tax=Pseudomonas sp. UBA6310 TaxID=1947327 RepID=UPI002579E5CB|nr:hypothetical protein [Pseudomonas sp. UBA6310]